MAMLEVLRSLSEVEQIPSRAELGMTMERTQAEAAAGEGQVGHQEDSSLERAELPREVLRWLSVLALTS